MSLQAPTNTGSALRLTAVSDPYDDFDTRRRIDAMSAGATLVVEILGDRARLQTLARSVLVGLRKDGTRLGLPKSDDVDWMAAVAHLAARAPKHLIVQSAHLLDPEMLHHLVGAGALLGFDVTLVSVASVPRRSFKDVVKSYGFDTVDIHAWLREVAS